MRQYPTQPRRPSLLAAALATVAMALACACALPAAAHADSTGPGGIYAKLGTEVYYSVEEAIESSYILNGATVVMQMDWTVDEQITIPEGKKVSIDMNGYTIASKKLAVFVLGKGSELTLTTNSDAKDTEIAYRGYEGTSTAEHSYTVKTGGLVTSAPSGEVNFTIWMKESSVLNLDGIAIAGSKARNAGGVQMNENTTLNMTNGTSIQHNRGSGVHAYEKNVRVNMDNASISGNTMSGSGVKSGGGISSSEENFSLTMTNGSKIDGNCAHAGGGVYLNKSHFTVTSPDNSGVISNNTATGSDRSALKTDQSGGGIHVDQREYGANDGLIEGLTISGNYSAYDGGGIELDQEYITIRNCVIKDNWCKYEGGGVYVCNDGNLIDGCTITGNACSVDSGGNYEGGGVFVWHSYDIKLAGLCVIKGNTRGKGTDNADDVMLRENAGGTAKAYITGTLAKGSSVGVRSGVTGDRRIAKNFKPETKDCLFYDMDSYYVSYGNDEGGDAWQRHTTREFAAKIDGETKARYKYKAAVALIAPLTKGDDKVFWRWNTDYTEGLYPISDYITNDNLCSNTLAFAMPQNDVDAAAIYATRATKVVVGLEAPVAGKALPSSAAVYRADGIGGSQPFPASVTWYEVSETGEKVAAAGTAKAGTEYYASVTCAQSTQGGLHFSKSLSADGVSVKTSTGDGPAATNASVDSATGALTFETGAFPKTEGEKTTVEDKKATVKMVDGGLEAGVGGGSASEVATVAALSDDAEPQSDRAVLGEFDVSWTEGDAEATIIAPAKEGYNFCCWEGAKDTWKRDDVAGTVTVPYEETGDIEELVAVYTPVVTEVNLSLDAPKAAGDELASSVDDLWLTCSNGEKVNFAELVGDESLPVTWSPEGEDGKAGYSTSYTAMIKVIEGAEDLVDVEKVVATGAVAVASNEVEAEAAGFTVVDGVLYLCVSFPATPTAKVVSVSQPETVELTLDEAKACAESGEWPLPDAVDIQIENGVAAEGDVEWEAVTGFDANATETQELQVKGKVVHISTADGVEVDASDAPLDVTMTIKIAAPAQAEGDGADASSNANDKAAFAKTNDPAPALAMTAVAAIAAAAMAVSVAAALRRRKS